MRDRVAGQRGWGFNCDYCDLYKIQNSLCAKNHRSIRHFVQNSRYSLTALSSNTETKGEKKKKESKPTWSLPDPCRKPVRAMRRTSRVR